MTTQEASRKFSMEEQAVRKCYKDGMIINAYKDGRYIMIPNDTILIPSRKDVQSFLLQIIKYKSNKSITISRVMCPHSEQLQAIMAYLYMRGFIGEYSFSEDIKVLFDNTAKGMKNFVIGANEKDKHIVGVNLDGNIDFVDIS